MEGYLKHTENFYGKEYVNNNPEHRKLAIGDICLVNPTPVSHSKEPYKVQIVLKPFNWTHTGPSVELCTDLLSLDRKGYHAVINNELFSRLEPIRL